MKINKLTVILLLSIFFISCGNSRSPKVENKQQIYPNANKGSTLVFSNDKFDFGKVYADKKEFITTIFEFENINESPLVIQKTDVSCGCVSTKYDKKPILKGEKGKVEVILDVNQLNGYFDKKIFVKSNAVNAVELLRVTGTVVR